jgi:hypothetical protein
LSSSLVTVSIFSAVWPPHVTFEAVGSAVVTDQLFVVTRMGVIICAAGHLSPGDSGLDRRPPQPVHRRARASAQGEVTAC